MSNPARPALLSLAAIGLALVSCQTQPVGVPYATETIEAKAEKVRICPTFSIKRGVSIVPASAPSG